MAIAPSQTCLFQGCEGPLKGQALSIPLPCVAGRHSDCDWVLSDERISRRHARLWLSEGVVWVEDLGTANGTYVNSLPITAHALKVGDILQLGNHVFELTQAPQVPVAKQGGPKAELVNVPPLVSAPSFNTSSQSVAWVELYEALWPLAQSRLPTQQAAQQVVKHLHQFLKCQWCALESTDALEYQVSHGTPSAEVMALSTSLSKQSGKARVQAKGASTLTSLPLTREGQNFAMLVLENAMGDLPRLEKLSQCVGGILTTLAVKERARRLEEALTQLKGHVSQDVFEHVLRQGARIDASSTGMSEVEATVLFCDIQGFTKLSEKLSPVELSELLNAYFQTMVEVIQDAGGEVNKFIGDAIMAVFGAPKSRGNDALHAVKAGLAMISALESFWTYQAPHKRFNIRIGINSGRMVAGTIGSNNRMEYTVLGDEVNVASRLEGVSAINAVTVGPNTMALVQADVDMKPVGTVTLKGKSQPMPVYQVLGLKRV